MKVLNFIVLNHIFLSVFQFLTLDDVKMPKNIEGKLEDDADFVSSPQICFENEN